ncbi:hypothetical protein ACSMXM_01015 [Pacificimonas sp. ICDLI1SI03]
MKKTLLLLSALVLAPLLGACAEEAPVPETASVEDATAEAPPPESEPAPASAPARADDTLSVMGWNGIQLGEAPGSAAADLGFADDGSYTDSCRIWSAENVPGVYLIVEQFDVGPPVVARISSSGDPETSLRTAEGIMVGSTEEEVRAAYDPLGEQPHKYDPAPAKNLVWGPEGSASALRFEIGEDGRVMALHAGISPTLGYVERCS